VPVKSLREGKTHLKSTMEHTEKFARELGSPLSEMALHALKASMAHSYGIWRTFRQALGIEKGFEFYHALIKEKTDFSVPKVAATLGIEEVGDIQTIGKMVDWYMTHFPVLYRTIKNTDRIHIGQVLWCPNPAYGPCENFLDRHAYFRTEAAVTLDPVLTGFVQFAQQHGFAGEVEVDVPQALCTNGNVCFCRFIIRKKGEPPPENPLQPAEEKDFFEYGLGDEEPLFHVLKKQGRTVEDQAPRSFLGFIVYDHMANRVLHDRLGKKEASEVYKKIWLTYPKRWVKEARLELELGKITDLEDLARIIAFCARKKFVPYRIKPRGKDRVALVGEMDPFVEMGTEFLGKKVRGVYLNDVHAASLAWVHEIISGTKMAHAARVTQVKSLAMGDDLNEMILERN